MDTTQLLQEILIFLPFIATFIAFVIAGVYGREVKLSRKKYLISENLGDIQLKKHEFWTTAAGWFMVFSIGATETVVYLHKQSLLFRQEGSTHSTFFYVHLYCFAIPSFLLFLYLKWWMTGEKNKGRHRLLAYVMLFWYTGTLFTGFKLLFTQF